METIEGTVRRLMRTENMEELLEVALTPKSVGSRNNERLEFLGNAVLNLRIAEAVYDRYPEHSPAKMSLMSNYLRSNPVLVQAGREGGLGVLLNKKQINGESKVTDKMVSTAFEAIVGTLYKHEGYDAAARFIDIFVLVDHQISYSMNGRGPITELKELVDRERRQDVVHSWSDRTEDGETIFCHKTTVNGEAVTGEGRTKKGAEAKAAARALILIQSTESP